MQALAEIGLVPIVERKLRFPGKILVKQGSGLKLAANGRIMHMDPVSL
jgi:hypothetical protein